MGCHSLVIICCLFTYLRHGCLGVLTFDVTGLFIMSHGKRHDIIDIVFHLCLNSAVKIRHVSSDFVRVLLTDTVTSQTMLGPYIKLIWHNLDEDFFLEVLILNDLS
jgi:hypothetical protein